jgi:hypothetical protein
VLDGFLGSGTTVIAAERTGRRCYGLELDPLYVDTVVRRWQAFTRERAYHAITGKCFNELEAAAKSDEHERRQLRSRLPEAEPVVINENGRRRKATKLQVIVKQMVNKAAQGDHRSIQLLMAFTERHQLTGRDGKPLTVVELLAAISPISHED